MTDFLTCNDSGVQKLLNNAENIDICSGEGDGPGMTEIYKGKKTIRALLQRITKETCHGDRWCTVYIDGYRLIWER